MRDYVINEAQSRLAYGRVTWLVRVVQNWRLRKDLKRLQGFSDYQLRDIGLTRGDLTRLCALPLDTDMTWHIERRELHQARDDFMAKPFAALPSSGRAALVPHAWMMTGKKRPPENLTHLQK